MKRLLLLPILLMGLSFACNAPHENVRGYKIGCPLEPHKEMEFKENKGVVDIYLVRNYEDIYSDITLSTISGNIEKLNLNTGYILENESRINKNDFLSKLNSCWGNFDIQDEGGIVVGDLILNNNPTIATISFEAVLDGDEIMILDITYMSKKMVNYENPKQSLNLLDGI